MVTNSKQLFEQLKIKFLSPEQLVLVVDRLTRFKPTEDKYLRVFKDLILQNLISPKFSKKDLSLLSFVTIRNLAEKIFNSSLENLNISQTKDYSLNKKLALCENNLYNLSHEVRQLLENKLNYKGFLELLSDGKNVCKNLCWLKKINETNSDLSRLRKEFNLHFPIEKIIITEGITEEILLPVFAKKLNYDFDKFGVHIISAGGKNQVVKLFYELVEKIKKPLFVLLDKDANENRLQIEPKLRKTDKIHLLNSGEFEDLLPHSLIIRTVNNHLKNFSSISEKDFNPELSTVKILEEIFKEKGLHEFKKVEFASMVAQNIHSKKDISPEVVTVFEELKEL